MGFVIVGIIIVVHLWLLSFLFTFVEFLVVMVLCSRIKEVKKEWLPWDSNPASCVFSKLFI